MKFIKSLDKFGHPVQFQFNNKGNTHKTFCGGLVSLAIILFMITYVYFQSKKWLLKEDDSISSYTKYVDPDDMGVVSYNEAAISPYFLFFDIRDPY